MKIKTELFQELLGKVIKGASNNKLVPMTSFIELKVENDKLIMTTTDATNYVQVIVDDIEAEPMQAVVNAELFYKLITKITSNTVDIELAEDSLVVKGNGEYKLEIQLDEMGKPVKFPDKFTDTMAEATNKAFKITKATIDSILTSNKSCVATTLEVPCYTGYYIGEDIITSDTYKVCALDKNIAAEPMLVSPQAMELLGIMDSETVDAYIYGDVVIYVTPNIRIFTMTLPGIEDFDIESISGLLDTDYPSECKISKQALLNVLDRILLFVGIYDNNTVDIQFKNKELIISSKESTGIEKIPYEAVDEHKDFEGVIDAASWATAIKSLPTDIIELQYGNDTSVKMISDDITQIIALSE